MGISVYVSCMVIFFFSCVSARRLWRDYFASGVDGVVFLVDAVDRDRFPEAKKELDVSFDIKYVWLLCLQFCRRDALGFVDL